MFIEIKVVHLRVFQRHLFCIGFCHAIFVAALNIMIVIDHNNNNSVSIVIIIPITLIDVGSLVAASMMKINYSQTIGHSYQYKRNITIGFIT